MGRVAADGVHSADDCTARARLGAFAAARSVVARRGGAATARVATAVLSPARLSREQSIATRATADGLAVTC